MMHPSEIPEEFKNVDQFLYVSTKMKATVMSRDIHLLSSYKNKHFFTIYILKVRSR